ncbi:hypothetical protein ACHAWF_013240 [Thalassiosira exigua]
MQLSFCLPCMEESGGELCFISHPGYDRRLSCNIFGHIWMDGNWKGWEVWRFTKIDDGECFIITSWTHDQKVLCSDGEGRVFTTENRHGSWEKWKVSSHPSRPGIRIQSVEHGRSLAFSGQDLYTMDKDDDTAWYLEPAHGNRFYISVFCHDKRLSSTAEDPFTSHNRKALEEWIIEPINSIVRHFTVRSQEHGKYLGSSKCGKLTVDESQHCWAIILSPHGGFFIQSVEHGRKLSCDDDGHPYTSDDSGGRETWRLEPIMPGTISGQQIWSFVGIGAAAVVSAVVMPFAVNGIVRSKGFRRVGIAAGSAAAGMMSAEAIASGGAVAAGGTVATLQSIGAAGLGAAGASAAAAAGVVAGGLSSFGAAAASGGLDNNQEGIKLEDPENHFPLCSWRMWG